LSIHHLEDADKRKVFGKIYESLAPGGVFINAEQVAGPTPALEARYKTLWLEQVRKAGASEEQIEGALYRMREDRCASVEDQLGWLRAAGFADADCWFKENRFAVLAGSRV
jgi:tRNA (cmo5U34)-methyltransferase